MPVIRILVTNNGKIVVEGIGYIGKTCLADLEKLQNLLKSFGVETEIKEQQLKPEAHQFAKEEVIEE